MRLYCLIINYNIRFINNKIPDIIKSVNLLTQWETYHGGSPDAERAEFERLAKDIMRAQARSKAKSGAVSINRALHAKPLLSVMNAKFKFLETLPDELKTGFAQPGSAYCTIVRLSNAKDVHQSDSKRTLRGIALRIEASAGQSHDLLMTNAPVPHARDGNQFVAFALAMSGNEFIGIFKLIFKVGPSEAIRMLINLRPATRPVASLALETFWSRGAMLWGDAGPVRFLLRPKDAASATVNVTPDLRQEIAARLASGDVIYEFCVQKFVSEATTPIENAAQEWKESDTKPIVVAHLTIPKQDVLSAEADAVARRVEQLSFNPWHTSESFRPLGHINRARKAVYEASSAHRRNLRFFTEVPGRNRRWSSIFAGFFRLLNKWRPWHRLPLFLSLTNLSLLRRQLRAENLIDTDPPMAPPQPVRPAEPLPEDERLQRTYNGSFNDLSSRQMGSVNAKFGRNMPSQYLPDLLNEPNPVTVAEELMARKTFIPATTLNILAASWIQFQVHDWVQHDLYKPGERDLKVPMPNGKTWVSLVGKDPHEIMRIPGNKEVDAPSAALAPAFGNIVSHWWDGSEVYGADECKATSLRAPPPCNAPSSRNGKKKGSDAPRCAKLELTPEGYLPLNKKGQEVTGFNQSWWLGLSAMHTLFAREHNAVCDELRHAYCSWSEEQIYQTARLVVSALIAKIHTIEWTPAILATEALDISMNANWSGPPDRLRTRFMLWLTDIHARTGIPDTTPDHHTAPYSLTEEFVSVYRMHPLIPDDYRFYSHADGTLLNTHSFMDIQGDKADNLMRTLGLADVLYSFGIAHPGAITLHNFPHALMDIVVQDKARINLAVVDIVRDRARGIPRYNAFRKGLHMPPVKHWEDLTANPDTVSLLRDIYKDIDKVDTVVGLLGETPPDGFGFSDTAFRIFLLMASRRLQSDRFLNVDFRPEIYSKVGYEWVHENTMTSVILRHHPELGAVLPRDQSAFFPWRSLPASV